MMCIPNWDGKERVARFKEYTQIVDLLLSNESSSFSGTYYGIQDAVVKPRPVQSPRPPIVIGALGPVMVRFSAQIADTWNTMSFAETFENNSKMSPQRSILRTKPAPRSGVIQAHYAAPI